MADELPVDVPILGAPLPQEQGEVRPMLEGMGEDKVVTVFNPLSQPFRVQYARTLAQAAPLNDRDRRMMELGVPVVKDGNSQVAHAVQYLVLQPGVSQRLPGDIAQIAVRQLVNQILQLRGKKGMLADPYQRKAVEEEIILNTSDMMTAMNTESLQESTERQLRELNQDIDAPGSGLVQPVREKEQEFPGLNDPTTNPPPGKGANFVPDTTGSTEAIK